MKLLFSIIVLAGLGYAGWKYLTPEALDNAPVITVTEGPGTVVPETVRQQEPVVATEPYTQVDNEKVGVVFAVSVKENQYQGVFSNIQSNLTTAAGSTISGSVIIATKNISTSNANATVMLKKSFETEKYPTASFTITSWKPNAIVSETFDVTGVLMVKGVNKTVSFPVRYARLTHQYIGEIELDAKSLGVTPVFPAGNITLTVTIPMK